MNKRSQSKTTPKLIPLAVAVKLLAVRLVPDDFDFADPATPRMLSALAKFRVEASPRRTPFRVASATLAVLVARANDPSDPAALWQLNKLVDEFGRDPDVVRRLSFEEAMAVIDRERARRGKPYRPKTGGAGR